MHQKRIPAEVWVSRFLRVSCGAALPIVAALGILLGVGGLARLAAEPAVPRGTEDPPAICGFDHGSRGESAPVDLEALTRGYAALKSKLTFSLKESTVDTAKALGRPFDLGLPACRGRSERRVVLKDPIPAAYRASKLYFVRSGSRGAILLPEALERSRETEILLVSLRKLGDLGELSTQLGRRITVAPPKLVEVLGVRCANTLVTFTEKGDEAILAEGD